MNLKTTSKILPTSTNSDKPYKHSENSNVAFVIEISANLHTKSHEFVRNKIII